MSNEEMAWWRARWMVRPWGEVAEWERYSARQAMHSNSIPTEKRRSPAKPSDFFPEDA